MDRDVKRRIFGAEPDVFRFPEYAVDEASVGLIGEMGYKGTVIPDFVFQMKGVDTSRALDRGVKIVSRNDRLSAVLSGNDFDGRHNMFRWLSEYEGTPAQVAEDFVMKVAEEGRCLTDIDAESYNHWLMKSWNVNENVLPHVYRSLLSGGVEMVHLPAYIEGAEPVLPHQNTPVWRCSYAGDLSIWMGEPGNHVVHDRIWEDTENCWMEYVESGRDPMLLGHAVDAQTSCWSWGATFDYPNWWKNRPAAILEEMRETGK